MRLPYCGKKRGGGGCWLSDRISAPLSVSDAVNPVCPVVVFIIRLLMKDLSLMCLSFCALGAHQEQTNVFVALGPVRNNLTLNQQIIFEIFPPENFLLIGRNFSDSGVLRMQLVGVRVVSVVTTVSY